MTDILRNLLTGTANKAWMGFVGAALPVIASFGLDLGGCSEAIGSWGTALIGAGVAGIFGGGVVYAVPNKK
jgi:hypothetical protein